MFLYQNAIKTGKKYCILKYIVYLCKRKHKDIYI